MTRERWLALFRFGFAALGLAGLSAQYLYNVANIPGYKPLNFFSFFTVESNIIAVVALFICGVYSWRGAQPRWVYYLRGAATIYMTVTGITYSLPGAASSRYGNWRWPVSRCREPRMMQASPMLPTCRERASACSDFLRHPCSSGSDRRWH